MVQTKQYLSELIGHDRDSEMSCGQWRTPPPFAFDTTHFYRRGA
jgi:hypothetical protein